MLMESTKKLTLEREDQRFSVVYIDVGPLSSWVLVLCFILVLVDDSYLLLLRVSNRVLSCFSEMGGDWKRYFDEEWNQFVEVM